ncbi:MAG: radical SAM family heme chaperone HemW [Bacteroides sp.]|nr:radical SAM family heme chaperone HemW [Bacillota bacterium]MCM1393714.1 radical SAM family heme chaperone HemW [[Eubacterium] siraeum]MCM1455365.1 radical SAM family heme chaperone HemW [Bacteroides sp.]
MQIYIHLPFCKSKCRYCDFNSLAGADEGTVFSYLAALNREIRFAGEAYSKAKIDTVYIGGGTPSMLDAKRIASIRRALDESFDLSTVREFTIECNPESIDADKLAAYREVGINRISIGVQSLNDRNLKSVGRLHDSAQAIEKIKLANEYFDNVSCDIIVGLPYDTEEIVKDEALTLAPLVRHMSVYALTLEKGTPLAERVDEGRVLLPSDDEVADMLEIVESALSSSGLDKYEVSNFAREGRESLHNFGYWSGEEYLGFGAGAHSYIKTSDGQKPLNAHIRFAHPKDINAYIAGINCAGAFMGIPRAEMNVLSEKDVFNERIMLGLRTVRGVESSYLDGRIPDELKGYFITRDGYTSLTRAGMAVMNSILVRIMEF